MGKCSPSFIRETHIKIRCLDIAFHLSILKVWGEEALSYTIAESIIAAISLNGMLAITFFKSRNWPGNLIIRGFFLQIYLDVCTKNFLRHVHCSNI